MHRGPGLLLQPSEVRQRLAIDDRKSPIRRRGRIFLDTCILVEVAVSPLTVNANGPICEKVREGFVDSIEDHVHKYELGGDLEHDRAERDVQSA
jgi:hypothetical protein